MRRSILYFDDEAIVLETFRDAFGAHYDVRLASSLAQARRLLRERPTEIVISDQLMPEISGTEFLAEVARDYPASFRILLTGSIGVSEAVPEITSGTVHLFITKPWTFEEMSRALERAEVSLDMKASPRGAK